MSLYDYRGFGNLPGIDDIRETIEGIITWGAWEEARFHIWPCVISGAARDAAQATPTTPGNTPTDLLRPGLLMGVNNTTKLAMQWNAAALDGTEDIAGPLLYSVKMTDSDGSNRAKWHGWILIAGKVKASELIIPGETTKGIVGKAAEATVRAALASRFILDDLFYQ